ncbi:MAG: hypothetical protein AAGC61_00105 [Microbacterium sp.]
MEKSFRHTMARPFSSVPPRQRETLLLKKAWISPSVIVSLAVRTASLRRFPGVNPAREVFASSELVALVTDALGEEEGTTAGTGGTAAAWAAVAGADTPTTSAETAMTVARSREVLVAFRERGARRDM